MVAPMISRGVTRWWKSQAAGAMMSMGVRANRVWAMPVEFFLSFFFHVRKKLYFCIEI